MVKIVIGDILKSNAQTIMNTVNCVGIMGRGIALEFKKRFPLMYKDYVKHCEDNLIKRGKPYLFKRLMYPWIINFPTKDHWRSVSRLEDIDKGLQYLQAHYKEWGITSLAIPPLGCGQGQLDWRVVGPIIYKNIKELDIPVELYAPYGTPSEELQPSFLDKIAKRGIPLHKSVYPKISPAWASIVEILRRIEEEPFHPPVGRTIFQKIAYFATVTGIPTSLHYQRGSYGPYTFALKKQITTLVYNDLIREERRGQMFSVHVGPAFDKIKKEYKKHIDMWISNIDKVSDLIMRMDTKQAEIAATVHFVAQELKRNCKMQPSEKDVLNAVMQWKQRRRPPLNEKEVAMTVRNLNMLDWISARASDDLPIKEAEFFHI